jgi:starch synthase
MNVLFVVSEAFPLVKTGGLGDVAGALSVALARHGADVRLLVPGYPEAIDKLTSRRQAIAIGDSLGAGPAKLQPGRMPGGEVETWLIDCPELYDRKGGPYTDTEGEPWSDNHLRFAMLGRAAALIGIAGGFLGWQPDIVHANDWQAGLAPAYLVQWAGRRTPTVFTIHNYHYQGIFDADIVPSVGLRQESFTPNGVEYFGSVSYLKAGMTYSDRINTVSPTYAREIQTPLYGNGLEGVASARSGDLTGILNGIDDETWNPATDPALVATFGPDKMSGKAACKTALQKEMGLRPDAGCPLIGIVSRFVPQKGLDLVAEAIPALLEIGVQLVVLGTGEAPLEKAFRDAAAARPGSVATRIGHFEDLSHRIFAGADMLLVPSRFEPCGLTQMYAMRYGTIPVVRRTGGLADTVTDAAGADGTGFLFDAPSAEALIAAVRAALVRYRDDEAWNALRRRAMTRDFGWAQRAKAYLDLYDSVRRQPRGERTNLTETLV